MYCGNCFRDNALVAQLRRMGHHALMVPLYLPLTLDEADQSEGTPLFFSGLNVYLAQKFNCFQKAPNWLRSMLTSGRLLNWLGNFAGKTRGAEAGDLLHEVARDGLVSIFVYERRYSLCNSGLHDGRDGMHQL